MGSHGNVTGVRSSRTVAHKYFILISHLFVWIHSCGRKHYAGYYADAPFHLLAFTIFAAQYMPISSKIWSNPFLLLASWIDARAHTPGMQNENKVLPLSLLSSPFDVVVFSVACTGCNAIFLITSMAHLFRAQHEYAVAIRVILKI